MKQKVKLLLKRIIIGILCIVSINSAILSCIPIAKASSSSILGTNNALGSPILNTNFTTDDWNKWEMICWGVFLSNFVQPLVDSYETAFKANVASVNGNSNGAGYRALCFGSGSDQENNKVIQSFCDYAILQSQVYTELYVTFSHVTYNMSTGYTIEEVDPNNTDNAAEAKPAIFRDFFPQGGQSIPGEASYKCDSYGLGGSTSNTAVYDSYHIYNITDGYLPVFWIKNGATYTKILDYTDPWDIQMAAAVINGVRNTDYASTFDANYNSFFGNGDEDRAQMPKLYVDAFRNITVNNLMLFPAAANKNITKNKDINLLTSMVFNGYTSTYSNEKMILGLRQNTKKGLLGLTEIQSGGLPAFTESKIGTIGVLYYDLDSVIILKNGNGTYEYTDALKELFDCDITRENNKYPLKFEISGLSNDNFYKIKEDSTYRNLILAASMMSNNAQGIVQPEMLSYLITQDGTKVDMFSRDPIIIANQVKLEGDSWGIGADARDKEASAIRLMMNWLYQAYIGTLDDSSASSSNTTLRSSIKSLLSSKTISDFTTELNKEFLTKFLDANPELKRQFSKTDISGGIFKGTQNLTSQTYRITLVYPVSETLKAISAVLGCVDGSEFSQYSTVIYMTYLDWYGVITSTTFTSGSERVSNFDPAVYPESSEILNVDPASLANFKSAEEKEEEVLNMSYLLLHPEQGRSYRKELIYNSIADIVYEQYNRIVFGGASDNYYGSASKNNSGFLAVETYYENGWIAGIVNIFADIAVIILGWGTILIIIVGLLKTRKISWFIFTIFTLITVIIIMPSTGDIVPYIANNAIQNMFSKHMTAWSMAEGIANATLEADAVIQSNNMEGLTEDEASTAVQLIKQFNTVYVDRSLMLRQDVSQKLTQQLGGVYTEIQSIQSARWVLPMIMQQFTVQGDETGTVYVQLANVWDDGTNLYWYYKPTDAMTVTKQTLTSPQFAEGGAAVIKTNTEDYENVKRILGNDFIEINNYNNKNASYRENNTNYHNYSYTLNQDENDNVHLYSWVLPDLTRNIVINRKHIFGENYENYENADSWQKFIDSANIKYVLKAFWYTTRDGVSTPNYISAGYEQISGTYDRTDPSTLKAGFSYYKTTESPYYYFFNVVKDSFPSTSGIGTVISRLQGEIEEDSEGNEVRSSFMFGTITEDVEQEELSTGKISNQNTEYTGLTRDILDLEYLFSNVIPYMYEMTLITGGFDGESGILVGDNPETNDIVEKDWPLRITDASDFYEGNLQSWAYRCNWAVKLMENPRYSKPLTVKTRAGEVKTVQNPMLPDSYPDDRPMVFSEAQMYALGLKESDLNIVELKCIEVNREVAKQWTLLINYAGTPGLTKEVLFRQMATDGTNIFTREFSSGGIMDQLYSIYPQSIDLRYLSFDAVMKMLMLNISNDTSYIYGDTMSTLIESTDIFVAILLLTVAFVCAGLIPLIKRVVSGFIFFAGLAAVLRAIFASNKYKMKVAGGAAISNALYLISTLLYYQVFRLLMGRTASDEILTLKSIQATSGSPVAVLVVILLASILYSVFLGRLVWSLWKNWQDMGFEMYSQIAGAMTDTLSGAIGGLGNTIGGLFGERGSDWWNGNVEHTTNTNSMKGTGIKKKEAQDVNIRQSNGSTISVEKTSESEEEIQEENYQSAYTDGDASEEVITTSEKDIDAEIEAGKQME